ncbi:hypothetical protein AVEN_122689-1 [Araneus ventricosus]|uniref:Uncharacterized protein n=1 Tax=Araneus ventricosus TaxID=182803 RepID=A0A4Y2PBD2_ARAVE|nr:hypothetical protein AVEN_122689-1 [Araneus ventricosus]
MSNNNPLVPLNPSNESDDHDSSVENDKKPNSPVENNVDLVESDENEDEFDEYEDDYEDESDEFEEITEQLVYNNHLDGNGERTYPINNEGGEYYLKYDFEDVILKTNIGFRYARNKDFDEFYPKDAENNDKFIELIYAYTFEGKPIFPKTKDGDEFYVHIENGTSIITLNNGHLRDYAKRKNGDEIYPKNFLVRTQVFRELILDNRYAKLSNGQTYYPLNEYGNEYTIEFNNDNLPIDENYYFPNSYAITNDEYIIVPNIEYFAYFLENGSPKVTDKNILGTLCIENRCYFDFLTNVKATRKSRSSRKKYDYLPLGQTKSVTRVPEQDSSNSYNIILIIILSILCIIIFFFYDVMKKYM